MAKFSILAAVMAGVVAVTGLTTGLAWAGGQSHDSFSRRLRIHNQTGWTMIGLQATTARSRAWMPDVLGGGPVESGASRVATIDDGAGACVYDFRASFSNGQTLERTGINVCEIADYYLTR